MHRGQAGSRRATGVYSYLGGPENAVLPLPDERIRCSSRCGFLDTGGGCAPARQDMFKQKAMKPGKVLIMASWLLNYSTAFSGFPGFLLKFDFRSQTSPIK